MIQIIKRGTRKTCTCKECGCLFSYEAEDVKIGGKEFPGYADFTMWACEKSNRLRDGLRIISMTVVLGGTK